MTEVEQKAMITAAAAEAYGLNVDRWQETDDGLCGFFGRWYATTDLEGGTICEDEEGTLYASVVGDPAYGNERVAFYLEVDGAVTEVEPFVTVEPL
jgi:hypothetical protein